MYATRGNYPVYMIFLTVAFQEKEEAAKCWNTKFGNFIYLFLEWGSCNPVISYIANILIISANYNPKYFLEKN